MSHKTKNNVNNPNLKVIFTSHYKGVEISCVVGNILMSNTAGVGTICDSRFSLASGLAKYLKDAIGNGFIKNLQESRQKQNDSTAIAVPVTYGLNADFVILTPVRNIDRNSLQTAYISIIDKAKEFKLISLTIPFLGTGQLGLSKHEAIKFLEMALTQIASFGSLRKLQFIDQAEDNMTYLRNFLTNEFLSTHLNQHVMHQQSTSSRKYQPYVIPDAPIRSRGTGKSDSTTILQSNGNVNVHSESSTTYDLTDHDGEQNESNASERNSNMDGSESSDSSDTISDDSNSNDSDLDDLDESSVEDAGFTSDSTDDDDVSFSLDEILDTSFADETSDEQNKKKHQDEQQFWSLIPIENLRQNNSSCEPEQKPSTSKVVEKCPNIDDSTLPCSICLSDMREETEDDSDVVQLSLCSHMFHRECIRAAFKVKKQCPLCMCWYDSPIGFQPLDATMAVRQIPGKVQGHPDANGFHEITYHIPSGIQTEGHIRKDEPYRGCTRIAYLPNNKEGTQVLKLLQLAFKRRLIFTIGDSVTTGRKNVPVWNGIHHKTNKDGGPGCYGYPDPAYLNRVKEELALVGVRIE